VKGVKGLEDKGVKGLGVNGVIGLDANMNIKIQIFIYRLYL
jgi:hypothetical protein